jgi:hypothetical protein
MNSLAVDVAKESALELTAVPPLGPFARPPHVDRSHQGANPEELPAELVVLRDLATGNQLLALPVEGESAKATRDTLEALLLVFGPPLVMKSDNGSLLMAEEV